MIVYKLTTQDNKTHNNTVWGENVTHSGTGEGQLCGPGYIHAYLSPELAAFLNPIHADIPNPKLWECSVSEIALNDNDLKVGSVSLTTIKEIPLPNPTHRQRVIFAILCAKAVQTEPIPTWDDWANGILNGKPIEEKAAWSAAEAAAEAAAAAAAWAAWSAVWAARSAAVRAADAAEAAEEAGASSNKSINLVEIAKEAMQCQ